PLATHIDGFAEYQASGAWVWEHVAVTRARVISGPEPLRRRVEQVIRQSLDHSHEPQRLIADILDMRRRLYREKGSDDPWQIKAVRGGLVDVEFIAQYLQLAHGKQHLEIYHQNTGSALTACRHAGVLSPGDADVLESAFRLYETVTQVLGLCLTGPFNPETCPRGLARLLAKATDVPDIPRL